MRVAQVFCFPFPITPVERNGRRNSPVRMINLRLLTQELPLPRLIGPDPPHQVSILLRLKQWYEMDAAPHFLAGEFTMAEPTKVSHCSQSHEKPDFLFESNAAVLCLRVESNIYPIAIAITTILSAVPKFRSRLDRCNVYVCRKKEIDSRVMWT